LLLYRGYIVTFTQVLTSSYGWIHPLHHLTICKDNGLGIWPKGNFSISFTELWEFFCKFYVNFQARKISFYFEACPFYISTLFYTCTINIVRQDEEWDVDLGE
jgi:hypothetical protein